jgi:AcrR family transcriptional regulator
VSPRGYRLGRRREAVDRTRSAILSAARRLVTELGREASVGKVAEQAGVSRITVYNQFGSKAGLFESLATELATGSAGPAELEAEYDARERLRRWIAQSCNAWASDPDLYRQLQGRRPWSGDESEPDRGLAEKLAASDQLRPGCSIKEAEDVIGILTSFSVFDRLHKGGRRTPTAVAEILMRMASTVVTSSSSA